MKMQMHNSVLCTKNMMKKPSCSDAHCVPKLKQKFKVNVSLNILLILLNDTSLTVPVFFINYDGHYLELVPSYTPPFGFDII